MLKRILGVLAGALFLTGQAFAGGQVIVPPSASVSSVTMGGDVSGGSGAATVARVNGKTPGGDCGGGSFIQALDASVQPTCAASAAAIALPYRTGLWYPFSGNFPASSVSPVVSAVVCSPGTVRSPVTPTALGSRNTAAGTGNISFAIYANVFTSGTGNRPTGTPLTNTGDIAYTTGGNYTGAASPAVTLQPGTIYWKCVNSTYSNTSGSFLATTGANTFVMMGDTSLTNAPTSTLAGLSAVQSGTITYTAGSSPWTNLDLTSQTWTLKTGAVTDMYLQAQ